MARQRMYVFERAYIDYAARLRQLDRRLRKLCVVLWTWFWRGPGAGFFETFLRIAVVVVAILLNVLYLRYELGHGRSISASTVGAVAVIFVFASLVLWGWRVPLHVAARGLSGGVAAGSVALFATLAGALACIVLLFYLLGLLVLTAASLLLFLPMRAAHGLWLVYRRIAYRCPYDDCSYSGMPIHICSCGERYADLKPSFYGIFHHICRHKDGDVKLPTLDFRGRKKLARLCGGCKRPLILSSIGELPERPVAVVGGTGAGKTVFLRQAVRQLEQQLAVLPGAKVALDAESQQRDADRDLRLLDQGQVMPKTAGAVMEALGVAVHIPKQLRCLLYLFDAPGEHFATMQRFGQKQILQYLKGIVLLVDPFSLAGLSEHRRQLAATLNVSETPFFDVVSNLIHAVNLMQVDRPTERSSVPLAVVLGKADAYPTRDLPFLANLVSTNGHLGDPQLSPRCRTALESLGEGRSIRALEQKFATVRYFACSALGRMPNPRDTSAFRPTGVAEPLLWLLDIG